MPKRTLSRWLIPFLVAGPLVGGIAITPPPQAVQFPDGRVAFNKAPRLLGARATFQRTDVSNVKYYFTIALPDDAGEPLQSIEIAQQTNLENIEFRLEDTLAFVGDKSPRKSEPIPVGQVTQAETGGPIRIELAEPIEPGTTFTVGIVAQRNPRYGGIYLFRVRAFPEGERPQSLALGLGRLSFFDDGFFRSRGRY